MLARDRWPGAEIQGEGEWCVLVECYSARGAWLYHTEIEARSHLVRIQAGCGHVGCRRAHTIVRLKDWRESVPDRFPD